MFLTPFTSMNLTLLSRSSRYIQKTGSKCQLARELKPGTSTEVAKLGLYGAVNPKDPWRHAGSIQVRTNS